ncbi:MAG TPA: lasso peptide biosynthesis B2 protein [Bacteroidales bacterium]|nr:lasso peptide biosynthesis B2 protein [Bacteroidales bacterium]HPR13669.1 lasso peptide biosynthesis B2 protein [Bacteroidales bacterium]
MLSAINRFFRLQAPRRRILVEATLFQYAAKLLLLLLPVRTVLKTSLHSQRRIANEDAIVLPDIKWALNSAARYTFWKNKCLVQSIAGRWMLGHRGISCRLSFGVKYDEERRLLAHAWLKSGDYEVVDSADDFHELIVC